MSKEECGCLECQIRGAINSVDGAYGNDLINALVGIVGEMLAYATEDEIHNWVEQTMLARADYIVWKRSGELMPPAGHA